MADFIVTFHLTSSEGRRFCLADAKADRVPVVGEDMIIALKPIEEDGEITSQEIFSSAVTRVSWEMDIDRPSFEYSARVYLDAVDDDRISRDELLTLGWGVEVLETDPTVVDP